MEGIQLLYYLEEFNVEAYINGVGCASPQRSLDCSGNFLEPRIVNSLQVKCIEPEYRDLINAGTARRMSRMTKMAVFSALTALKQGGVEMPDAIISGTAMGSLQDTEKFLNAILDDDEQFLTPTSFIQSTHNTIGAQIAILLKCRNYNFTHVQGSFSFENALLDGLMKLQEPECENVLVGGHDEMTDDFRTMYDKLGYWKKGEGENILETETDGAYSGEGAAYFALSQKKKENCFGKIIGVQTVYKPADSEELEQRILTFLKKRNKSIAEIDLVFYGINGDKRNDGVYYSIKNELFGNQDSAYFKHLSGEYATSSSFALYLAAFGLKTQKFPEVIFLEFPKKEAINNVLIVNGFMGVSYSLILVEGC